MKSVKFLDRSV